MLLDAIANSREEQKSLLEVARRRIDYLASRAGSVAERTRDRSEPLWQSRMVQATLWMEAAECSTMIAKYDDSKQFLSRAATQLLQLRLPVGAALQRVFFPKDEELAEQANGVMLAWRERVKSPSESRGRSAEFAVDLAEAAHDTAQQWAYYALAAGGVDRSRGEMGFDAPDVNQHLNAIFAAPVGRFRFPLDHYRAIAEFSGQAIGFGKMDDVSRRVLAEVIGKSLVSLFRSLQWGRSNSYLWTRLLAPVPLFDLDTAMMINRGMQTAAALDDSLMANTLDGIPEEARGFAKEFIEASVQIAPKPEEDHVKA